MIVMIGPVSSGFLYVVGGVLSLAGFSVPFYVAAVVAVLAVFIIPYLGHIPLPSSDAKVEENVGVDTPVLRHPWCDPMCILVTLCNFGVYIALVNWPLLLPLLLSLDTYSVEEDHVAMKAAIACCVATFGMLVGVALSDKVTQRVGKITGTHLGAIVSGSSYMLLATSSHLWQVFVLMSIQGLAIGLNVRSIMPAFTSYIHFAHRPDNYMAAFALLNMGEYCAYSVGQTVTALLIGNNFEVSRDVCVIMGCVQLCAFCGFGIFQWLCTRAAARDSSQNSCTPAAIDV